MNCFTGAITGNGGGEFKKSFTMVFQMILEYHCKAHFETPVFIMLERILLGKEETTTESPA
jgi:hypothetical protein